MSSETPVALRQRISDLRYQLECAEKALSRTESGCHHQWTTAKYTPEYREAYTIPGDPPGTMGVDWRGPSEVPARTIKRWTRRCLTCGKVEVTERTRDRVEQDPIFTGR